MLAGCLVFVCFLAIGWIVAGELLAILVNNSVVSWLSLAPLTLQQALAGVLLILFVGAMFHVTNSGGKSNA